MKEIGNIIAGAYLSALSTMTNLKILPSIPYIAVDMAASILSVPAIQFGQYGDNALFMHAVCNVNNIMHGGICRCFGIELDIVQTIQQCQISGCKLEFVGRNLISSRAY